MTLFFMLFCYRVCWTIAFEQKLFISLCLDVSLFMFAFFVDNSIRAWLHVCDTFDLDSFADPPKRLSQSTHQATQKQKQKTNPLGKFRKTNKSYANLSTRREWQQKKIFYRLIEASTLKLPKRSKKKESICEFISSPKIRFLSNYEMRWRRQKLIVNRQRNIVEPKFSWQIFVDSEEIRFKDSMSAEESFSLLLWCHMTTSHMMVE